MGCCSSNQSDIPRQIPSSDVENRLLGLQKKSSMVKQDNLVKRFSNQIEKIKELRVLFEKNLELAKVAQSNFSKGLEKLEFYFSKKPLDEENQPPESIECPSCLLVYDTEDHRPLLLNCDHSLCYECANSLYSEKKHLECPIDKIVTNLSPDVCDPNSEILELVESIKLNLFCFTHSLPTKNFCITCKKLACSECKDHKDHPVKVITDETVTKEMQNWEKNLESYVKKLSQGKDQLLSQEEGIRILEEKMKKSVEDYINQIKINKDKVIESIQLSSDAYMDSIHENFRCFQTNLPVQSIKVYSESISSEIDRAEQVLKGFNELSAGEKIDKISKVDFKAQISITKPDMNPWENSCVLLSDVKDYEAVILALIGIPIS